MRRAAPHRALAAGKRLGRPCLTALLWAGLLPAAFAHQADTAACDQAASVAETEFQLPAGILRAIGAVESGGWPWSANVDGVAEIYQTKAAAVEALSRVRSPRPGNVDIGCFQISSRYHPAAFPTVADALDPATNARYAARFLAGLREKYGDWERAVGAYHSTTVPLEAAYRQRVLAQWKDVPQVAALAVEQPKWRVIAIGAAPQPAVGVWSLSAVPASLRRGALPRVITREN